MVAKGEMEKDGGERLAAESLYLGTGMSGESCNRFKCRSAQRGWSETL